MWLSIEFEYEIWKVPSSGRLSVCLFEFSGQLELDMKMFVLLLLF